MIKFIAGLFLGLVALGGVASAASVFLPFQGGTGQAATPTYGQLLVGNDLGTFTLMSTSSLGITSSGGGGGGNGTVSTSSPETSTRVPFWTSTGATPATLSGGNANFTFNNTGNLLTVTNASTTAITSTNSSTTNLMVSSYASTTNLFVGVPSGIGDASVVFGPNGYEWSVGYNSSNNNFNISSSTILGSNNGLSITKAGLLTFTYASTTGITTAYASTTALVVSSAGGAVGCATFSAVGVISNTGVACGSGSGSSYPFVTNTNFGTTTSATTTSIRTQGVFFASSTAAASQFSFASTTMLTTRDLTISNYIMTIGTSTRVTSANGPGVYTSPLFICDACNGAGRYQIQIGNYGSALSLGISTFSARGTSGAPTATQSGDILNLLGARGFGSTVWNTGDKVALQMSADENFTDSSNPTRITLETTPTNSTTRAERVRITPSGSVLIGTTTGNSLLHVTSGASATTTVSVGTLGLSSSKACVNMNTSSGAAASFFINAAGAIVVELNYCK